MLLFLLPKWFLFVPSSLPSSSSPSPILQLSQCAKVVVRKEFRDMSPQEWIAFRNAILSLQNFPSPSGPEVYTEYDYWTKIHIDHMHYAHANARFFPWHRAYVLALERRLQEIDPSIVIPFWDWTYNWRRPLDSPIFSPDYGLDVRLGGSGDCRYQRQYYKPHCLMRKYDPKSFVSFYSPQEVSAVIHRVPQYDEFRELIEMVPHAIVHASIGGDMSLMNSPNDPLFWLHHSMVDMIWWIWQRMHPNSKYYGNVTEILEPFGVTVSDVLVCENLCYTYQPFSQNSALINGSNGLIDIGNDSPDASSFPMDEDWLASNHVDKSSLSQIVDRFKRIASLPLLHNE